MFNTRPNTVELSGITMELDALHKAYVAIYSEAQSQLENLDINDTHIDLIADRLRMDHSFANSVGRSCSSELARSLRDASAEDINDTKALVGLVDVLTNRILQIIGIEVEERINTMVERRVSSAVDDAVAIAIANTSEIKRGTDALAHINRLLQLATNDQITETTT